MALAPIALFSDPLEDYEGYWLKAYSQGTTTPIVMATDSGGLTTVAKAEISSGGVVPVGFLKTAGDVIFIPYVDEAYDLFLFPTEAEADANDTTNAIQLADDVSFLQNLPNSVAGTLVANMIANTEFLVGDFVTTVGYTTPGDGGDNSYEIVAAATGTDDGGSFIDLPNTTPATQAKGLFPQAIFSVKQWGTTGDGATDDTATIQAALDTFNVGTLDGGRLWFPSGAYKITTSLAVSSNLWIQGDGEKTFIDATTVTGGNAFSHTAAEGLDDLRITDMRIRGNSADNDTDATTGNAIYIANAGVSERLKFSNLRIERFKIGIHIESSGVSESPSITDCWIEECSRAATYIIRSNGAVITGNSIEPDRTGVGDGIAGQIAIWFPSGSVASMNTLGTISNNTILSATTLETINIKGFKFVVDSNTLIAGTTGVVIEPANTATLAEHGDMFCTISNNYIEGASEVGIVLRQDPANADFLSISHCTVVGNTLNGCDIGIGVGQLQASVTIFPSYNVVADNNVWDCTSTAISVDAAKFTTLTGNLVHSSGNHAVLLRGICDHTNIGGGFISAPDASSFGILIQDDSTETYISDVDFFDCGLQGVRPNACDGVYVNDCHFDTMDFGVAPGAGFANVFVQGCTGKNIAINLVQGLTDPQVFQFGSIQIFTGTGTPLGVVVANIGDQFNRTDGGAVTTLYIKEADSGANTGWVAK